MKVSLKKKIVIILPIILLVVIAIIGAFVYAALQRSGTPVPADTSINLGSVPQYGACELATSSTIKQTFNGDRITQIVEGTRRGEHEPNGTIGEACVFNFTTARSNTNSLTISVYDYTSSANGTDSETVGDGWSEVGGSQPIAYFNSSTEDNGKTTVYTYRILPGSKNVLVTLREPTATQTFTSDEAFNFIGGIASKLDYGAIAKKTDNANADTTPGAVTDTP